METSSHHYTIKDSSGIECNLHPEGSAFVVYAPGKVIGKSTRKPVVIGIVENHKVLECIYIETHDILSDIAFKLGMN